MQKTPPAVKTTRSDSLAASILDDSQARLRERAKELNSPRQPATPYTAQSVTELDTIVSPTADGISHLMTRDTPPFRRKRASESPSSVRSQNLAKEYVEPTPNQVPLDPMAMRQINAETANAEAISLANPYPLEPKVVLKPNPRQRSNSYAGRQTPRDPNNNAVSPPAADGAPLSASRDSIASADSQTSLLSHKAKVNRILDHLDGAQSAALAPKHFRIGIPKIKGYTNGWYPVDTVYPPNSPGWYLAKYGPKTAAYGLLMTASIPILGVITSAVECAKEWGVDFSARSLACPWVKSETNEAWLTEKKNRTSNWTLTDPVQENAKKIMRLVNASEIAAEDRATLLDGRNVLMWKQDAIEDKLDQLWAAYQMDPATGAPYLINGVPLFNDLEIVAPVDMDAICMSIDNTPTPVCWGEAMLLTKCTPRSEAIVDYVAANYNMWNYFQYRLLHAIYNEVLNVAPQTRFMDGFNTRRFNRLILNCKLPIKIPEHFPKDDMPYLYGQLHPGKFPIPKKIRDLDDTNRTLRTRLPQRVRRDVRNYPIAKWEFDHPTTIERLNEGRYSYLTATEAEELRTIMANLNSNTTIYHAIIVSSSVIVVVIVLSALTLRLTVLRRAQELNHREQHLNLRQMALERQEFGTLEYIEELDEGDESDEEDGAYTQRDQQSRMDMEI